MYYIYALKCEELVLYVGQTIDMRRRFNAHKRQTNPDCGSRDIPDDMDFYMDLLEVVDTIEEARQQEQFYYDTLKPFYNTVRPGQTKKECNRKYYEKNKQKIKEYVKEYREENKEKIQEYRKVYYIVSKKK
jgi:predicted GIY-YIG superfamily endonuclease